MNAFVSVLGKNLPEKWKMVGVMVSYLFLAAMMTLPIAGRIGQAVPGQGGDVYIHLWTFEWVKDSLLNGRTPFFTEALFYPEGVSLLYHNIAWLNIIMWLPLRAAVGGAAAYSILYLIVIALNGFALYLLAVDVVGDEGAAYIAGIIGAFFPYTLSHHDHPNLIFICWIPLALLAMRRVLSQPNWRNSRRAALIVILIGVTRWQLLIMAAFLLGFYLVWALAANQSYRSWTHLKSLLGIAAIAGIPLLLLASPIIIAQISRPFPEDIFVNDMLVGSTDLLAYVLPSRYHPLWGSWAFSLYDNFIVNKVFVPFLGYGVMGLIIVGLGKERRKMFVWLGMAIFIILLALGPQGSINGASIGKMPASLLQGNFFYRIIRRPDRFNVLLSIPVAMLAAHGWLFLRQLGAQRQLFRIAAAMMPIIILGEYVTRYEMISIHVPAWYQTAAQDEEKYAILGVPMSSRTRPDKAYMFYQLTHHKPIVEGHVSRIPREALDFIERSPLLNGLQYGASLDSSLKLVGSELRYLADAGIRYLILHKEFLSETEVNNWREWLKINPAYEDLELAVYRTDPQLGRDYQFLGAEETANVGEGALGLIDIAGVPATTAQDSWVTVESVWGTTAALSQDIELCIRLVGVESQVDAGCQPLAAGLPATMWSEEEIVRAKYQFHMNPKWQADNYQLHFLLNDQLVKTAHTISHQVLAREMITSADEFHPLFQWDDQIALVDYGITWDEETVVLNLSWMAIDDIKNNYVVFAHILDAESGELVTQHDAAPRNWGYPTYWWIEDEIVTDEVALTLPAGAKQAVEIYLGLYHSESGERFVPFDAGNQPMENNQIQLFP